MRAENQKHVKDVENLEAVVSSEQATRQELEVQVEQLTEKYETCKERLKEFEGKSEHHAQKIERLTALNEEMRELIE